MAKGLHSAGAARAYVLGAVRPLEVEEVPLARAVGRVLAAPVRADRPYPPFPKAAMDGYAVRRADIARAGAVLREVASIAAGETWSGRLRRGECARIMTGGPLPRGADMVVPVERCRVEDGGGVRVEADASELKPNFDPRGVLSRKNAALLSAGGSLDPASLSIAAAVGAVRLRVHRRVAVHVLSTGAEIARPDRAPGEAGIRDSNGPLLRAILARLPWVRPSWGGIVRDDRRALTRGIARALERADVVLLSGGVSAGDLDLVPRALADAGVEEIFHRVAIRPGKPLWFGTAGARAAFGLPGNPLACLVTFCEFALPGLRRMAGFLRPGPRELVLPLLGERRERHGLEALRIARVVRTPDGSRIEVLPHRGSGDFISARDADGIAVIPTGRLHVPAGTLVEFHPWGWE